MYLDQSTNEKNEMEYSLHQLNEEQFQHLQEIILKDFTHKQNLLRNWKLSKEGKELNPEQTKSMLHTQKKLEAELQQSEHFFKTLSGVPIS